MIERYSVWWVDLNPAFFDPLESPLISRVAICGSTTWCPDPGRPWWEPVDVVKMALA